jgi:hypothetical protein
MKTLYSCLLILFLAVQLFAQDVIVRKDGIQIECKIISADGAKIYYSI